MKRAVLISLAILFSPAVHAADLFEFAPQERVRALSADQTSALDHFRSENTTKSVQVIRVNIAQLKGSTVDLNVRADTRLLANSKKIDERTVSDYTWYGNLPEVGGDAILVVQEGNVTGTIRAGTQLYRIRPLGGDLHALLEVDETKFPPDEPPEFHNIEQKRTPPQLTPPPHEQRGDVQRDVTPVIEVMVAYTAAARTASGGISGLIQLAIDETNQSYQNSGISARLHLAHAHEVTYSEASRTYGTILDHFSGNTDGFMEEVHTLRDQVDADVAVLIFDQPASCGLAEEIMADAATAFALVHYNCATGNYSFGHEIGHLQGARHDRDQDSTTTPYAYGHGFKHCPAPSTTSPSPDWWRTIMAYECNFAGSTCPAPQRNCRRLQYWSNPNVQFGGVAMGTAESETNARVLNETATTVAAFRPIREPVTNFFQNRAPGNNNYELVVRQGDALRHYYYSGEWIEGRAFGSNITGNPTMFQNHALGNNNYEVVVRQGDALRHYYHDTNSGEWIEGRTFGSNITGNPTMFQNHAPGNNNYEVVVRQGNALRHYYYDTNSGEWIEGQTFGASSNMFPPISVTGDPIIFQNHARGNNNYEVVMTRITEGTSNIRMKHYTFDGLWREGWDFGGDFALAMFQNHASGNNNYELVARSANRMTHFWRDYNTGIWNLGSNF